MGSVALIRQEAENLPEFHSAVLKRLELKEKIIFLAHLLAQMKIALVTSDDEKLTHCIHKFLHGDVCGIEKVKADFIKAKKQYQGKLLLPYEQCMKKVEKEFSFFVKEAAYNRGQ